MAQTSAIGARVGAIGSRVGPVKILRVRSTRHFLYLLVRCTCGKSFGHRADRRRIVCYSCGRMAELPPLRAKPLPRPKSKIEARRKPKLPRGRAIVARPAPRRARPSPRGR